MLPRLLPDQCLIFTFSFGMEIYVVNDTQNSEINKGLLHEIIFFKVAPQIGYKTICNQ